MSRPKSLGTSPETPAVRACGLSKTYVPSPRWMKALLKSAIDEPVVALDDVSFEVRRGEICVVIGPNGAGKSTLFRILTGLTTPTSGSATIVGHDINEGRVVRSLIGFMPAEDRNLMLRHTSAQNLEFRGRLQGIPRQELPTRIDEVLERTGILHTKNRAATALSTGMKARLQLAAALLHEPKVLILDEPTSAVDPVGAHELLSLIEQLAKEDGLSILLSSHRLEEIDALQNKVVMLDGGRAVHNGNLAGLRHVYEAPRYLIEFTPDTDVTLVVRQLRQIEGVEIDVVDGSVEIATARSVGSLMASLGAHVDSIISFDQIQMPLRVLMHKLVSGEIEGSR